MADLHHHRSIRSDSFANDWARLAPTSQTNGSLDGGQRRATIGQPVPLVPGALLNRLRAIVWDRSKRRENDKAFTIQRHLRAIRQAEDLDRQTHFRRSQVQRLVQRFDQSCYNPSSASTGNEHSALQDRLLVACVNSFQPTFSPATSIDSDPQRQQRILLVLLCQLIGARNVRKLASALARCGDGRFEHPAAGDSWLPKMIELDLRLASDRELAIALLNCLGRMVQRSIECLETAGQLSSDSFESVELLIRSSGSQKSNPDDGKQRSTKLARSEMRGALSKGDKQDGRNRDMPEMDVSQQNSSLSLDESVGQKTTEEQADCRLRTVTGELVPAGDKSGACDTVRAVSLTPPPRPVLHGPASAALSSPPLRPLWSAMAAQPEPPQATEDPIKRALDTIMGANLVQPACVDLRRPEVDRARKCGRSAERCQHTHRSRTRRPATDQQSQHRRRSCSRLSTAEGSASDRIRHTQRCSKQANKDGASSSCHCLSSCCYCCCCNYLDHQGHSQNSDANSTCICHTSLAGNGPVGAKGDSSFVQALISHRPVVGRRSRSPRDQQRGNKSISSRFESTRSTRDMTGGHEVDGDLIGCKMTSSDDL